MEKMKEILLYAWQLPQNLLGLLLVRLFGAEKYCFYPYGGSYCREIYVTEKIKGGISLGNCIIVRAAEPVTVAHETGHQVQSRRWGWLYLLTVGLWSGIRCELHLYRPGNYYKHWPEKQADRLGGVVWADGKRTVE